MSKLLSITFLFLLVFTPDLFAGTLTIKLERPDFYKRLMNNNTWSMLLDGDIDSDAPARVSEALQQLSGNGIDVYLNSRGGDLLAGMQIGELLRESQANTHIGSLVVKASQELGGQDLAEPVPGICYSACALAFLGGSYRYANAQSEYGVHRFYRKAGRSTNDIDIAQLLSAAIGAYIRKMDVSSDLFDLMVQTGKNDIRLLSRKELTDLKVVNNGRKVSEWSIEATEESQYLRGMQTTVYGEGKSLFVCWGKELIFQSFYRVSSERAEELVREELYHSLLVDGKPYELVGTGRLEAENGELFGLWRLSREQALAVASSSLVGHAMQYSRTAPTFIGYEIEITRDEDKRKVRNYILNCFKK